MNIQTPIKVRASRLKGVSLRTLDLSRHDDLLNARNGESRDHPDPMGMGRTERRLADLLNQVEWPQVGDQLGLSERECAVVRHILEGQKLTAIADDMDLGLGTVKTYCGRVYRKLRVSTQSSLAVVVLCGHFTMRLARANQRTNGSRRE